MATPWAPMKKQLTEGELFIASLLGQNRFASPIPVLPEPTPLDKMAAQTVPVPPPEVLPPTTPQPNFSGHATLQQEQQTQQAKQEPIYDKTTTTRSLNKYLSKEDQDKFSQLQELLEKERQKGQEQQMAGIKSVEEQLGQYKQEKLGYDLRPLAALIDQFTGGNTFQAVSAVTPESPKEKRQVLLGLEKHLQDMKGGLSKDTLSYLKEQLGVYNDIIKTQMQEERYAQRIQDEINRREGTWGRFDQNKVEALSKRLEDVPMMTEKMARLSYILPQSGPIPGLGVGESALKDFMRTSEGSAIQQDAIGIIQALVKLQSGIAASDRDVERKLQEYGITASSTEDKFRRGMKNLFDEFVSTVKAKQAGYKPHIQEEYQLQGGLLSDEIKARVQPSVQRKIPASQGGEKLKTTTNQQGLVDAALAEIQRRKEGQ